MCHSLEPTKTTDHHDHDEQPRARPGRRSAAARWPRSARFRASRLILRRGGPTASGSARSRRALSAIGDLFGPGRPPPARRWSSQLCRIATAAAWSITARCSLARTPASRSDRCGADGGQPLVGQPHRCGGDPPGQRLGKFDRVLGRAAGAVGQGARQSDDHLDRVQLGGELRPAGAGACRNGRGAPFRPGWPGCRRGRWRPRRCARCPRRCRAVDPARGRGWGRRAGQVGDAVRGPLNRPALSRRSRRAPRRAPRRCRSGRFLSPAPGRPCRRRGHRRPRRAV